MGTGKHLEFDCRESFVAWAKLIFLSTSTVVRFIPFSLRDVQLSKCLQIFLDKCSYERSWSTSTSMGILKSRFNRLILNWLAAMGISVSSKTSFLG